MSNGGQKAGLKKSNSNIVCADFKATGQCSRGDKCNMNHVAGNVAPGNAVAPPAAVVMGAPQQQMMVGGGDSMIATHFGRHNAMLVKQTMRGCLQECCGCEAKSEFKVAGLDWNEVGKETYQVSEAALSAPDEMYALESSSFCMRCCWRDGRPFNMEVSAGGEQGGGKQIVHFKKPCGFPLNFQCPLINPTNGEKITDVTCPCCCALPKVDSMTPDGNSLNSESRYICDINLYVPKLKYYENGNEVYMMKPETCCGGCCISCNCCSGKGCVFIPFYFHDPKTGEHLHGEYNDDVPQIRKVWAGLKKECCSTADTFAIKFPDGIDPERKAGLLGMTFLLDFTVFERQNE